MTTAELAEMVRVMRRDQLNWHQNMTQAAAMKCNYSERVVDKAIAAILADEPGQPEPEPSAAEVLAVHYAMNQL